ncbi:MAG: hemolysin III family protein [Peptoniphilus sp. oral taxon 375]|nr:hemolysin III family protein [Peptoniphilus sp. oral taxon 375]
MKMKKKTFLEILNSISHGLGVFLGITTCVLLCVHHRAYASRIFVGELVYISSFILLFLASTLYHGIPIRSEKNLLRVFDHSAIFIFIAGSYTPIVLSLFENTGAILFLILIWGLALAGFCFKLFTIGRYDKYTKLSTFLYIGMGWISAFLIPGLVRTMGLKYMLGILIGGILYTLGTYFYRKTSWTYHHVVWHLFVLAGAVVQLVSLVFGLQLSVLGGGI